ncbi:MAG: class I SAM-dependent methyltransferase, partial [Actinomycetota bacterium]
LGPAAMVGVDLSESAVELCARRHPVAGLSFRAGDAERLPFPDGSFDAVLNVESSHCYPSMETFLSEVRRVLEPGGHFLFADFRPDEELTKLHDQLVGSRLSVLEREVITPNVVAALELDSDRKMHLIRSMVPAWLRGPFSRFAGIQGSHTHEGFRSGRTQYVRYVARKDA